MDNVTTRCWQLDMLVIKFDLACLVTIRENEMRAAFLSNELHKTCEL